MNWINLDWIKNFVSPQEFKLITITLGLSAAISFVLVKADRVIENQARIYEAQKIATVERKKLIADVAEVRGRLGDKNEVLRAISNQAAQNSVYINGLVK